MGEVTLRQADVRALVRDYELGTLKMFKDMPEPMPLYFLRILRQRVVFLLDMKEEGCELTTGNNWESIREKLTQKIREEM